ncbi:MAG TPA: transcription antitermination factor NusB [Woeseiaceae bacterium]|nr:transcription antitermination factor NusB [Woeseiaceae bacterium]
MSKPDSTGPRGRARELLVQALYQMQVAGHDHRELLAQFRARRDYERVDREYFDEALRAILEAQGALEEQAAEYADRPLVQLDPVERGILLLGFYELRDRLEVPYRVVINEAVNLAKRFGAEDGHKYINAVLDRAAEQMRPAAERTKRGG